MKLSQAAEYAVFGLIELDRPEGAHTVPAIAKKLSLSAIFLSKIFQKLKSAGFAESRQGKSGGFILAKPLSEVSLLSVIEAIDGPLALRACIGDEKSCSGRLRKPDCCRLRTALADAQKSLLEALSVVKLSSIA